MIHILVRSNPLKIGERSKQTPEKELTRLVRSIRKQSRPRYLAATAVARQWLLCMPPMVITQSAPWALASAMRNSSFRTLLPLSCIPVKSSLCRVFQQNLKCTIAHTKVTRPNCDTWDTYLNVILKSCTIGTYQCWECAHLKFKTQSSSVLDHLPINFEPLQLFHIVSKWCILWDNGMLSDLLTRTFKTINILITGTMFSAFKCRNWK